MLQNKIKRTSQTSNEKRNKAKDPTHLRNIIGNQLIENNLISFKSVQRSPLYADRPQTSCFSLIKIVYSDRLRKQMFPSQQLFRRKSTSKSGKGQQMEFMKAGASKSTRLVRNQSQNLLGNISHNPSRTYNQKQQHKSIPFVSKQNKINMKKALGKVNLLASRESQGQQRPIISQEKQLQAIFNLLKCLSETENHYRKSFQYIYSKLEKVVYFDKTKLDPQPLQKILFIAELTTNKRITNLVQTVYNRPSDKKTTFKSMILEFASQVLQKESSFKQNLRMNNQHLAEIGQELLQKTDLLQKMSKKLKHFEEHPSQNHYPELMNLRTQNKTLKNDLQQQLYQIKTLDIKLQNQSKSKIQLESKIQQYKKDIFQIQLDKKSGVQQVQESSQLKQFESNVVMLKQMLDKSIMRMSGMKEQYNKLKVYNQQLIAERSNLAKRAAVGFGQLTPRPNFKKIFSKYDLNYNAVFQSENGQSTKKNSNKEVSTEKFVDSIIQKFKDYYETYKLEKKSPNRQIALKSINLASKQDLSAIKKKKKGNKQTESSQQKAEDRENQFDKAMAHAYKAKDMITKTMMSANQVKNAYARSKEEKQKALNK